MYAKMDDIRQNNGLMRLPRQSFMFLQYAYILWSFHVIGYMDYQGHEITFVLISGFLFHRKHCC